MDTCVPLSRYQAQIIDLKCIVPKGHLVRLVDKTIDSIILKYDFLSNFKNKGYAQDRKGYNPVFLFKILVYGYMYKISSSRSLEEQCRKEFYLNG